MIQTVTVGGFPLVGADSLGGFWRLMDLQGWHDGVSLRRNRQDRAQQDGAWASTGFRSGRPITLSGMARFGNAANAKFASRNFRAIVGNSHADMMVIDSGGEVHATVELDGDLKVVWLNELMFNWTVLLYATDPLLYGAAVSGSASLSNVTAGAGRTWPRVWPTSYGITPGTTPGSIGLPNVGSAAYWPTLRVDGPVPNPTITCNQSGAWVRYNGTVLAGQWLTVDCANRRVLLNGQVSVRSRVTSSGDWLSIAPGGGSLSWAADAADPAAKLSVYGFQGAWL